MDNQVGNWTIGEELGSGGCGSVFKAVNNESKLEAAVKVIDIAQLAVKEMMRPKQIRSRIEREIAILRSLNHPNIVKLYEALEKNQKYYIFMELVTNGELLDYIGEDGLPEATQKKYFKQIISAVDYCHKQEPQVIHRDLKLENLLVDKDYNIKITDFGFSNFQEGDTLKTMCGTPEYAPPEVFLGRQYMGTPFDMWSTGVILYAMATGYFPFRTSSSGSIMHKEGFEIPDNCNAGCADLIKRLLQKEPKSRPTAEEVLQDPWLNTEVETKKKDDGKSKGKGEKKHREPKEGEEKKKKKKHADSSEGKDKKGKEDSDSKPKREKKDGEEKTRKEKKDGEEGKSRREKKDGADLEDGKTRREKKEGDEGGKKRREKKDGEDGKAKDKKDSEEPKPKEKKDSDKKKREDDGKKTDRKKEESGEKESKSKDESRKKKKEDSGEKESKVKEEKKK